MVSEPIEAESSDASEIDSQLTDSVSPSAAGTLSSPVAEKVYELLAPVVATADVELLDVDWTGGTLRVVLDHPDGVTTDSLTKVNRLVSPILDQHDPIPGRYTLEVSSPGVERPLRRVEHYRRAIGENIVAKTVPGIEPRRVRGLLESLTDSALTLQAVEVNGVDLDAIETMTLELADIASARTIFDWGPTPKPGTGKLGQKAQPKKPHNKNQKQSQRKVKKATGSSAKKSPKPSTKLAADERAAAVVAETGRAKKPQPNTSEQERDRP